MREDGLATANRQHNASTAPHHLPISAMAAEVARTAHDMRQSWQAIALVKAPTWTPPPGTASHNGEHCEQEHRRLAILFAGCTPLMPTGAHDHDMTPDLLTVDPARHRQSIT